MATTEPRFVNVGAAADAARDKLTAMGVAIEDTADGTIWKPAK